ncbi:hypothetical protein EYR38_002225 [Pleurotus pulmonarius]|nr:hypothetical protein EYR38_002225 [Pleurotus pulmonarius]
MLTLVVSPVTLSSADTTCNDDSLKNVNIGRSTIVSPRVSQCGLEAVDEDKACKTWQSEDGDPGAVKGKGVTGRTGIAGKGALGMEQAASSGILPPTTIAHADLPVKKAVVMNGRGKPSRVEVLTPPCPCPNAVMHHASLNIGSGSSEGVKVGEGGEASSRSVSASIRASNIVNGGQLPNPALLALDPEAVTAAIQPSRKYVVVTNTLSEGSKTAKEDEEEGGQFLG